MLRDAVARHAPYKLAFIDYRMTGFTGLELGKVIGSNPAVSTTKIDLVSACNKDDIGNDVVKPVFRGLGAEVGFEGAESRQPHPVQPPDSRARLTDFVLDIFFFSRRQSFEIIGRKMPVFQLTLVWEAYDNGSRPLLDYGALDL